MSSYLYSGYNLQAFKRFVAGLPKQRYKLSYHHGIGGWRCELLNPHFKEENDTPKYCFDK